MKLTILGSGGAMPVPRPFCQCKVCRKARKVGAPHKRNSSSLLVDDIKTVIDCGEDIADSLNLQNIKNVENLFITHWHPDHTFGLRAILEANFNFRKNQPDGFINLYIPKSTYKVLQEKFSAIDYFIEIQKTGKLHLVEDGDRVNIKDYVIDVIGYTGKESETYAFLLGHKNTKALYSPCDTLGFANYRNFKGLDLLITECGLFSGYPTEISFDDLVKRIRETSPKKVLLTHLEEAELNLYGEEYLKKMKKKYFGINLDFVYDGMKIKVN